jgi:hypothetical protein
MEGEGKVLNKQTVKTIKVRGWSGAQARRAAGQALGVAASCALF